MIGYEPLQIALKERYEASLPAALAAITGEFADSVPLPDPRAYRLTNTPEEQDYPVVFILPGTARADVQTGRWLDSTRELIVIVEHREESLERLGTALVRYERALLESALGQHAPSPAHGIRWIRTDPGAVFEDGSQPVVLWQSWMRLTFELTVIDEDRIA